jgi:pyrroline-5-carboxylate reductase
MALTREALLGATEVPTQTVPIPELGGSVVVRGMNARERTQFEKKFITEHRGKQKRNLDAFREQLCVFCCVDPKLSEADLERLSLVRADIIERIANVAAELSGISEKDIDELGSPSPAPTATSTSSSASPTS